MAKKNIFGDGKEEMAYFPYGYEKVAAIDDSWRINDTFKVRHWILDTLPDAVYFDGDMYLNERFCVVDITIWARAKG